MSTAPVAFTLPVTAVLVVLAVLAGVTARRGWAGTLRRTGRLGLHSPAASAGDEAFGTANRVAAPVVGGAAVVGVTLAAVMWVLPVPVAATVVIGLLGIVAVLVMLIAAGVLGERAARTLPVPARRPQARAACDGCACGGGGCAGLTRKSADLPASDMSPANMSPTNISAASAGADGHGGQFRFMSDGR